jgi:hypothetical protein
MTLTSGSPAKWAWRHSNSSVRWPWSLSAHSPKNSTQEIVRTRAPGLRIGRGAHRDMAERGACGDGRDEIFGPGSHLAIVVEPCRILPKPITA